MERRELFDFLSMTRRWRRGGGESSRWPSGKKKRLRCFFAAMDEKRKNEGSLVSSGKGEKGGGKKAQTSGLRFPLCPRERGSKGRGHLVAS